MDILSFLTTLGAGGVIGIILTYYFDRKLFVFKTIHQNRAHALIDLYRKICLTEKAFSSLINLLQGANEPNREEKKDKFIQYANDFLSCFLENKIYLNDELEEKINDLNKKFFELWIRDNYIVNFERYDWKEAVKNKEEFEREISPIIKEIKSDFQKIIGINNK